MLHLKLSEKIKYQIEHIKSKGQENIVIKISQKNLDRLRKEDPFFVTVINDKIYYKGALIEIKPERSKWHLN